MYNSIMIMVAQRCHAIVFIFLSSFGTLSGSHWRPVQGAHDWGMGGGHFAYRTASFPLTGANALRINMIKA